MNQPLKSIFVPIIIHAVPLFIIAVEVTEDNNFMAYDIREDTFLGFNRV